MTIQEKPPLDEALLMHFGVKGMKWGVHKERTNQQKIQAINRKIKRVDANDYLNGVSLRGHYSLKKYNRVIKKNPDFHHKQLSKEAAEKWNKQATRRAVRGQVLRGAIEVGAILGGTYAYANHIGASPQAKQGAYSSAAMLAGYGAFFRAKEIRSITRSVKVDKLKNERDQLGYVADRDWKD